MSNTDDTDIYFLSRSSFEYLPNYLKKILLEKGK